MTMQSSNLLPALQEIPVGESGQHKSFHDHITGIVNMDRATSAAEFASAVSFGMWPILGDIDVDPKTVLDSDFPGTEINDSYLQAAYERTSLFDPDMNVVERWGRAQAEGPEALIEFYSKLKGIVAEFNGRDQFNQNGYNLELADNLYQRGWDLHGTDPNGEYIQIQVKTGVSDSQFYDTLEAMRDTDFPFALGTELHERISENAQDVVDQIYADIGPDYELVAGMEDGLTTLSDNMGIDIPDGVVDIIPYAAVIAGAARLIHSVIKTEKEFKAADRTTKNKIQVVQTLTLMSRMGITTVCAVGGGAAGGAVGSIFPGAGNIVGGVVGTFTGAGIGMYLNKHLQPHMLNLALDITGLTNDDLFYYKNKPRIDTVALSFQRTAGELAAAPA